MIKENELRIENLVSDSHNQFIKVDSLHYDKGINIGAESYYNSCYIEADYSYDKISGIPLTPEILQKCNTTKSNNTLRTKINDEYFSYFDKKNRVEYLHQWQNIVYALTGEELIINL